MPKEGKRSGSLSASDSEDSNSSSRHSQKKSRVNVEPRPGTSAQALKEMRKEQADFKNKKSKEQKQKRPLPETDANESGSKRARRTKVTNSSVGKSADVSVSNAPKTCREYLENRAKGLFDYEQASGIIKKISLYNFMCHSSFEKEWHPNLNFVTGENGSGKSALLSAIIIGLGAKALATSRTKSISNLVQNGKDFAKTEITLLNSGGVSEEKYGKEFMIERVLSLKGSSQYRIKCHGKFRSLPRAELDFILLSLDIQLDNPLMILNQETARSFLRSKDPRDKYKLFFDGTMMSKLLALLIECEENIDVATRNVNSYKQATGSVERQNESLKKDYKKIKDLEKVKDTVKKTWEEYLWSLVQELEKKKETEELRLQAGASEVDKFEVKLQAAITRKTEIMEKPSDKEEEIASRASLKSKETSLSQFRQTYVKVRGQITESKAKLRGIDDHIKQRQERMEECQASIDDLKKKAKEDEEKINSEYTAKKYELESKKAAALQQLNALKADADQFRRGADTARQEMHELKDHVNTLSKQIERTENSINNLRKSSANRYSTFGKEIQDLVAKVNANESKFKKKPVGPIGAFCTVKDSKWVNLVEFILGQATMTFVVDNVEDSKIFRTLMNSVYGKYEGRAKPPTIFVSKFTSMAFDISANEARVPGIPKLLDLIEIEGNNHIVFNLLCDLVKAERILLFENKISAINFIGNENRCPRTCIAGYSLDFYQVTPNPHYAVWAQNPKFQAAHLKTSTKEQIAGLRNRLTDFHSELRQIKPTLEEKTREEARLREEQNDRQTTLTQVRNKSHEIDLLIQQLNKKRSFQPDLTSQMEELAELKKKFHDLVAVKEAALKCVEENKDKMDEINSKKDILAKEIAELTQLISSFAEKADSRQAQLQKIDNAMGRLTNVISKYKKEQETYKKSRDAIEVELQRKLATAEETCSRVETEKEPAELENEFKTMKNTIAQATKILGSKEDIERKLRENIKELKIRKSEYKAYHGLINLINSVLIVQKESFERSKGQIGDHLSSCFHAMATQRGYQGSLLVDHELKELFYFVCPDGDAHSKTQKVLASQDAKLMRKQLVEYSLGLSGGERSYATICFIISMWQVMDCPFFMLDEFSVFMDPFNRKASENALTAHAKRFKAHQFFFFTPLELLTQIPASNEGCVLRMFPPVRNQDDDEDDDSNVPPSPNESVGEVENTDPSNGSRSSRMNGKKPRSAAGSAVMREKTNARR